MSWSVAYNNILWKNYIAIKIVWLEWIIDFKKEKLHFHLLNPMIRWSLNFKKILQLWMLKLQIKHVLNHSKTLTVCEIFLLTHYEIYLVYNCNLNFINLQNFADTCISFNDNFVFSLHMHDHITRTCALK